MVVRIGLQMDIRGVSVADSFDQIWILIRIVVDNYIVASTSTGGTTTPTIWTLD